MRHSSFFHRLRGGGLGFVMAEQALDRFSSSVYFGNTGFDAESVQGFDGIVAWVWFDSLACAGERIPLNLPQWFGSRGWG